jgi:hypothetical protein
MWSFTICTLPNIIRISKIKEDAMHGACSKHGRGGTVIPSFGRKTGRNGRIILKWT